MVDTHLVVTGALYFFGSVSGLAVAIPIGLTLIGFDGNCLLYNDVVWETNTTFTMTFGANGICHFACYMPLAGCALYGCGMTVYYMYAIWVEYRRGSSIGSQMWVMPWILLNSLVAVLIFACGILIAIGLANLCSSLLAGEHKGSHIDTCMGFEGNINFGSTYNSARFYTHYMVAMVCCFVSCLTWATLAGLAFLRLRRNQIERAGTGVPTECATSINDYMRFANEPAF
ncbi:PREDICTED: uncharacterized protein LOC106807269 [Priapulus caudatus]|uniref:Uncharacterized protein LOC106807269 n=1 Tax=Priapulus caudatus TaxID=37621 RepID=A0ABM1DYN0_PRICU|nr:PREDICTED: uncharacterized protein LOC106807269 [Priapulus caudatus]